MIEPDRIKEIFAPYAKVDVRKMFGGAGVYRDGLCFAMEADGDIYLKVDDVNREDFRAAGSRPFVYHMKGEPKEMNYWRLADDAHDDAEALKRWAHLGFEAAQRAAAAKPGTRPKDTKLKSRPEGMTKGKNTPARRG